MKLNLIWDDEEKTIRGSFINMFLTFSLLFLIIFAVFSGDELMVKNIKELQGLIVWFYGLSFGLWSGKRVVESVWGTSNVSTKIEDK